MNAPAIRRLLAALAVTAAAWLGSAGPVQANPAQVAVEYGGTLEAGGVADRSPRPAADDSFQPEEIVDWAKDNAVIIVVVVGALLVVGTWKFISR